MLRGEEDTIILFLRSVGLGLSGEHPGLPRLRPDPCVEALHELVLSGLNAADVIYLKVKSTFNWLHRFVLKFNIYEEEWSYSIRKFDQDMSQKLVCSPFASNPAY